MPRHHKGELFGRLAGAHDERRLDHSVLMARALREYAYAAPRPTNRRATDSGARRAQSGFAPRAAATGRSTTNGTVPLASSHPASAESPGGDPRRTGRVDVQAQEHDRGIGDAPRGDAYDHRRRHERARIARRDAQLHEPCVAGCTACIPRPPPDRTVGCVLRCSHAPPTSLPETGEHRIAPGPRCGAECPLTGATGHA